ncbi:MAG TPA: hypothetical protein VFO38_06455 [Candidatus Saccharimonadales bacterium]|nr:hypothetical protein [Candidatus Saccharimonadales bacterium]
MISFKEELEQIDKLVATPNLIREFAISQLRGVTRKATLSYQDNLKINNAIQALANIKDASISSNYRVIYNQVCVLAASALEAILKRYFIDAANDYTRLNLNNKKLDEIKVTLRVLIDKDLKEGTLGENIILSDNSLKFQDLQSIKRAFLDYFSGMSLNLDTDLEKKLIFYLEVRHVIVHKSSYVDKKFLHATSGREANLRSWQLGDKVQLDEEDWKSIKESYALLLAEIIK